jgi:hypothetical protein
LVSQAGKKTENTRLLAEHHRGMCRW